MPIADFRREYALTGLRRKDLQPDPLGQFRIWFDQAAASRRTGRVRGFLVNLYKSFMFLGGAQPIDFNAMTLATADRQGRPSARVVLLKGIDARGFIFYTNYESRKGHELAENPQAACAFYWPNQERQVCVAGEVVRLSPDESEAYFKTRPRGSRLAAWASNQSDPVPDRTTLDAKWKEMEARYAGQEVPRPPYWGGYVLCPNRIEFWQGRPNRLHDRFRYTKQDNNTWKLERLSP